jgi:hypothetical protein
MFLSGVSKDFRSDIALIDNVITQIQIHLRIYFRLRFN